MTRLTDMTKTCTKCGEIGRSFAVDGRASDGLQSACRECSNKFRRTGRSPKQRVWRERGQDKTCSCCNRLKSLHDFYWQRSAGGELYPRGTCKGCDSERSKANAAARKGTEMERASRRGRDFRRRAAGGTGPIPVAPGSVCTYCPGAATEIDHIWPISRGGSNDPENLTPACGTCNRSKGSKTLAEWLGFAEPERSRRS